MWMQKREWNSAERLPATLANQRKGAIESFRIQPFVNKTHLAIRRGAASRFIVAIKRGQAKTSRK
jgi:hypothetical protein